MLKLVAFQVFGMFLSNLLGGPFFDKLKEAVVKAATSDKSGKEKQDEVKAILNEAVSAGKVAAATTATWAVNLAIEYSVAQLRLASTEVKK